MNCPSGLSYKAVESIIETIANNKAKQYCGKIAYLDSSDIRQEIRLKCWNVLPSYNPKRAGAKLSTFLSVCSDNKIKDIKRKLLYKHDKPCSRCEFNNKNKKANKCVKYKNKNQCSLYNKHEKYVQIKFNSNYPIDINEYDIIDPKGNSFVQNAEFFDFIYFHLPSGFYYIFDKLRSLNFEFNMLKPREKKILRYLIGDIYIKYGDL